MFICKSCGNCDINKLHIEKHVFKNNTFHIKLLCKECGYRNFIPRNQEAYLNTKNTVWVTDHSKAARRARELEFRTLSKQLRKAKKQNTKESSGLTLSLF